MSTAEPSRPGARTPAALRSSVREDRAPDRFPTLGMIVLAVLFGLAAWGFAPVYGTWRLALTAGGGIVLGLGIAAVARRWRLGIWSTAGLVLLVHILLGPALAAPESAWFGILPSPSALLEMETAPVTTWKTVLTMAPPLGTAPGTLMAVWLSTLLLSLGSGLLLGRTGRFLLAWCGPLVLLAVTVVLGTTQQTWPFVRGIAFGAISLAWLAWRLESGRVARSRSTIVTDAHERASWASPAVRRRVIGAALILALTGSAAAVAAPMLDVPAGSARYALRDSIVPPSDLIDYTSPLAQFRGYRKNDKEAELFTVTGVREGELLPLAAMDRYTPQVYEVAGSDDPRSPSGAFLRIAAHVNLTTTPQARKDSRKATFTIGKYHRVWLPTAGAELVRIDPEGADASELASQLYRNSATQTLLSKTGLHEGDRYAIRYLPYREPTPQERKSLRFDRATLPAMPPLDPKVKAKAQSFIGDETSDFGRMQRLTAAIKDQAFLSHGLEGETPSFPGHGEARILKMLEEIGVDRSDPTASPTGMIGDQEQLATLTAVLARSLDIPARVVMGFEAPEPDAHGTAVVTGDDVTAWVEVKFAGYGWVRFDPTPETTKKPTQPEEKTVPQPKPQVAQPPPPPVEPVKLPPALVGDAGSQKDPADEKPAPTWVVASALGASPLLLILLLALTAVAAKAVRRSTRRLRGPFERRIAGGWAEIIDRSIDLGAPPPRRGTRAEIAAALDQRHPDADLPALAAATDREVFGPEEPSEESAAAYWTKVERARRSMGTSLPWWKRLWASVTPRSLFARRRRRAGVHRRRRRWTSGSRPGRMDR